MQQVEATSAEPDFVVTSQKFRSFLLSIGAILQTTKLHKIGTLECVHFYFLYPCSAHLHEIMLYLEYLFLDLSSFLPS